MIALSRLSLFLMVFAQFSNAVVETAVPFNGSSAAALQLSSFSVNPATVLSGEPAEFEVQVSSFVNTVEYFQATIFIYESGGNLAGTMPYAGSAIAGGETQAITRFWDTAGKKPGAYRAFINATFAGNESTNTRSAEFTIASSIAPVAMAPANNTAANGTGVAGGVPGSKEQDCNEYFCGEWEECIEGYRLQACAQPPGCSGKDFFRVEKCPQDGEGRTVERKICAALPQACAPQGQEQNYLCACLPAILVAIVFFALLLTRRMLRRRF